MYDDDRFSDSFEEYAPDETPDGPPRRRGCLFLFVSLLLVVTLIGSTLAAWFILAQRSVMTTASATSAPARQPTLAPATLVAALPTPLPTPVEPTPTAADEPTVKDVYKRQVQGRGLRRGPHAL